MSSFVCRFCKSKELQQLEWVQVNTGVSQGPKSYDKNNMDNYYCTNCDSRTQCSEMPDGMVIRAVSPDGFDMYNGKTYATAEEAKADFEKWCERFQSQGYYSSNRGPIDLDDLYRHMQFVMVVPYVDMTTWEYAKSNLTIDKLKNIEPGQVIALGENHALYRYSEDEMIVIIEPESFDEIYQVMWDENEQIEIIEL